MVEGIADFRRFMYQVVPRAVAEAARRALEDGANELVAFMKQLAPKRSGALADSIGWRWGTAPRNAPFSDALGGADTAGLSVVIFAGGTSTTARAQRRASGTRRSDRRRGGSFDSDVARYQEFGTSKMPANPFFWPAYRALKRRILARITRAIGAAFRTL